MPPSSPYTLSLPDNPDILLFPAHWILPMDAPAIAYGFVAMQSSSSGCTIHSVGKLADLPNAVQERAINTLDEHPETLIITPGLINTHTHLELSFPEAVPIQHGQETMSDWLSKVTALKLASPDNRPRCESGLQHMIQTGTTCINDISCDGTSPSAVDAVGLRAVIAYEFFHPGWETLDIDYWAGEYEKTFRALDTHPLIRPALSPHALYNVSPRAWKAMVERCQPWLVHSHIAESLDEHNWCLQKPNQLDALHQTIMGKTFTPENHSTATPLDYLDMFDLWHERLVLAHGVYTTAREREKMKANGAALTHCPRSNLFLQQDTLNWNEWDVSGATVSLGTDSTLSNDDLDLRAEARYAIAHHGWSAEEALQRLTRHAARTLSLDDIIGTLTPHKAADIVIWNSPPSTLQNPYEITLAPTTTAQSVFVTGQQLL